MSQSVTFLHPREDDTLRVWAHVKFMRGTPGTLSDPTGWEAEIRSIRVVETKELIANPSNELVAELEHIACDMAREVLR
jgi:hypothetical protein